MKTYFIYVLFFISFTACTTLQTIETPDNSMVGTMKEKDGKCYEKCYTPLKNPEEAEFLAVYTGYDKTEEGVGTEKIEIVPASTKWIKKTADGNCLSRDPSDCLVWCLVDVPAEYKLIYVVTDTSKVKDFIMRPNVEYALNVARESDWFEVVCQNEQDIIFNMELSAALKNKGYSIDDEKVTYLKLRSCLNRFQRDFNLPVGGFNLPTMQFLGLK